VVTWSTQHLFTAPRKSRHSNPEAPRSVLSLIEKIRKVSNTKRVDATRAPWPDRRFHPELQVTVSHLPVAGVEVVPLVAGAAPVVVGGPVVGLVVGVLGLLVVEAGGLLVVTGLQFIVVSNSLLSYLQNFSLPILQEKKLPSVTQDRLKLSTPHSLHEQVPGCKGPQPSCRKGCRTAKHRNAPS